MREQRERGERSERGGRIRPGHRTILVLLTGVVASVGVGVLLRCNERHLIRLEAASLGKERTVAINREFHQNVELLHAVRAFFAASERVDRAEFDAFVKPLLAREPAVLAVEWLPRTTRGQRADLENRLQQELGPGGVIGEIGADGAIRKAGDREVYFPVAYLVESQATSISALGFDHASVPSRWSAMRQACDSGLPRVTERLSLFRVPGTPSDQHGVLVVMPVYQKKKQAAVAGVADRQSRLAGYTAAIVRTRDLVERALARLTDAQLHCRLVDRAPQGDEELGRSESLTANFADGRGAIEHELAVAGRTWVVQCCPSEQFIASRLTLVPLASCGVGLLLTGCFTLLISVVQRRAKHVEQLVAQGMAEVNEINRQLGAEVADRRAAEELLAARAGELEAATARAEAANVAKSDFLANMSHELRTPLTAILGFTDVLLTDKQAALPASSRELLATIEQNGKHLIAIINDILDLSKIDAGKLEIEQVACSPAAIIHEVLNLLRLRAAEKRLSLEAGVDGSIPAVIGTDPTRLRQILFNLVGNAVKFTDSGSVRVQARMRSTSAGAMLEIDVSDTGIGIDECQVREIFEPFSQADASVTRDYGGTGLGLAICKRLVDRLGGAISASSRPGGGSTFTFCIAIKTIDGAPPVTSLALPELDVPRRARWQDSSKPLAGSRLLLVEDGPDNRRLISHVLEKAGAELAVAEHGQFALDLVLDDEGRVARSFDVILMDMQMPVLDGYAATSRLRDAGYTGAIIALTAHAMPGDDLKCRRAGCDGYATKPIDRVSLIETVLNSIPALQETG